MQQELKDEVSPLFPSWEFKCGMDNNPFTTIVQKFKNTLLNVKRVCHQYHVYEVTSSLYVPRIELCTHYPAVMRATYSTAVSL